VDWVSKSLSETYSIRRMSRLVKSTKVAVGGFRFACDWEPPGDLSLPADPFRRAFRRVRADSDGSFGPDIGGSFFPNDKPALHQPIAERLSVLAVGGETS
jgi:hypothetical protein